MYHEAGTKPVEKEDWNCRERMVVDVSRRGRQLGMRTQVEKLTWEWGRRNSFLRWERVWIETGNCVGWNVCHGEGSEGTSLRRRTAGGGVRVGDLGVWEGFGSTGVCFALKTVKVTVVKLHCTGSA